MNLTLTVPARSEVAVIDTESGFSGLETVWNTLLPTSPTNAVSLTFEWLKAWQDSYGKKSFLSVLSLTREGRVAALAPLAQTRSFYRGAWARVLHFMDSEDTPRMDFLCGADISAEEAVDSFVSFLRQRRDLWDLIILRSIPESSPTCAFLREALERSGLRYAVREGLRSPFIRADGSWEDFLATFSRKFHKTLRNQLNRMQKAVRYGVSRVETSQGLSDALAQVFDISGRSWKARYKRDLSNVPLARSFFQGLTQAAGRRGWLDLWLLSVEDRPVAFEFQLRYEGRVYALRSDFDKKYADLSPGIILQRDILESVFRRGLKAYDFCGHEDAYKKRWTAQTQAHRHFYIYADSLAGRWSYLWDVCILFPLGESLKKITIIRRMKKWLTGVGMA